MEIAAIIPDTMALAVIPQNFSSLVTLTTTESYTNSLLHWLCNRSTRKKQCSLDEK
jgi:hypothetical protein